jgi:SAM-dependent methyltransferase
MGYDLPIIEPTWLSIISGDEREGLHRSARENGITSRVDPDAYRFAYIPDPLPADTVWHYTEANPDPEFLEQLRLTTRGRHPAEMLNQHVLKNAFEGTVNILGFPRPVLFAPYSDEMRSNIYFADGDRHLTDNDRHMAETLSRIDLTGMNVLEIGFGTGYISRHVLAQDINYFRAYDVNEPEPAEIDEAVYSDPRADFLIQDYRMDDLSFMESGDWAVIANPPYFLLEDIRERIIDRYKPEGVVLITSQKRAAHFPGFEIEHVQSGMDFDPPALGLHFIISSGFEGRRSGPCGDNSLPRLKIQGEAHFPDCPSDRFGFDPRILKDRYAFRW